MQSPEKQITHALVNPTRIPATKITHNYEKPDEPTAREITVTKALPSLSASLRITVHQTPKNFAAGDEIIPVRRVSMSKQVYTPR